MENEPINTPIQTKESSIKGEKIIFDLLIKEKLRHVIIIRDDQNYHINLDGEDLGYFCNAGDGTIKRFTQPKGAEDDVEEYFKPIEDKLSQLANLKM
jgi:hypothetical protein